MENRRLFLFKGLMWVLAGLAAAVAVLRFSLGLGVSTALSDTTPWGLWIGFDVMGGVALAAGGFVMAAVVHVFHRERYRAAARPAILTAFLGYGAVAVGLLFDLGLPWNIWHPVVFWNPRSPLFEVAWCVMLYLAVLGLEIAPVILVKTPFRRLHRFLTRLALPIMILGIMLSTLHQSSLGSLLLIMPFRVHPLWYSHLLPELFFVSAICLGLVMVMLESTVTSWLYRREPETEMLSGLARLAGFALAFYFLFKMADLVLQGKLGLVFDGTWPSRLFVVEMLLSALVPMVLFAVPAVRRSPRALGFLAGCSVAGFVLDRINASGLSQVWATRTFYFPAWTEFAISVGIVAACVLVFLFVEEHFPVDPHTLEQVEAERKRRETALPAFAPFSQVWLGEGWRKSARVYSFLFVLSMALGVAAAPKTQPALQTRARRAVGADILRIGPGPRYVYFDHKKHQGKSGGTESCALCHHLHQKGDVGTPCVVCHRKMFLPTDVFDHDAHVTALEGNASCVRCHGTATPIKVAPPSTKCSECHQKDLMAANPVVKTFDRRQAPSYKDAMHKMCIPCHEQKAREADVHKPDLGRCGACHNSGTDTEKAYESAFPEDRGHVGPADRASSTL
jgi:Ni/Fe-hydrogenase subunit HybB-like protein